MIREEEKICKYLGPAPAAYRRPSSSGHEPAGFRKRVRELLARLREEIPGITLRTSLMVGFPGETEKRFPRAPGICARRLSLTSGGLPLFPGRRDRCGRPEGAGFGKDQGPALSSNHAPAKTNLPAEAKRTDRLAGSEVLVERPGKSLGVLWEGRTQGQAPEVDGITFLTKGRLPARGDGRSSDHRCHFLRPLRGGSWARMTAKN